MVNKLLFRRVKLRFLNVSSEGRAWKDNGESGGKFAVVRTATTTACSYNRSSWSLWAQSLMLFQFPHDPNSQVDKQELDEDLELMMVMLVLSAPFQSVSALKMEVPPPEMSAFPPTLFFQLLTSDFTRRQ